MAITSGTYTIGSGGDYATINAFITDIGVMDGDLYGQLISDSTSSANAPIQKNWGGYTIYLEADSDHGGDQTAAHVLTIAHNNNGLNPATLGSTNVGTFVVSGFRINRSVAGSNATKALINAGNLYTGNTIVHHMFLDGGGLQGVGIYARKDQSMYTREYYTNLIWDCTIAGIISDTNLSGGIISENNTIRNCGDGQQSQLPTTNSDEVNNTACFSNATEDFDIDNGTPTGKNNASTDATADDWNTSTDNLINLTETDEVLSTIDTSTDFMRPKSTSNIKDSGVAPTITANTTDIAGVAYDGTYPIGCYLEPSSPGGSITNYYYQLLMAG